MKVISFVGAKGGCGATTTAVNVAICLQAMGEKVCIVDAAPEGHYDVGFILGAATPLHTDQQLLSHQDYLTPDRVAGYLHVPRAEIAALELTDPENWSDVFVQLRGYSMIVSDGYLESADQVVLVASPDPLVLRTIPAAMARLQEKMVSTQRITQVMNFTTETQHQSLSLRVATDALRQATLSGRPLALSPDSHAIVADWQTLAKAIRDVPKEKVTVAAENKSIVQQLLAEFQDKNSKAVKGQMLARDTAESEIRRLLAGIPESERVGIDVASVIREVLHEALGLGPLEPLMADPAISEIMVNGSQHIFVERHGQLETLPLTIPEKSLARIIERILAPLGRRVDESSPMVDARLADGSRVNVVVPPLALNGSTITIRRFSPTSWTLDDLIRKGSITEKMADFLRHAIHDRKNIIVSGGTGSGKTTLLNVLSSEIPGDERIITIEDAAELRLTQPHVVRLESRPPNLEGKGAVTIRDLVKNALRMRPNRIIVGECRGAEALDMLQAMNTGHDGSLTTVHANSPQAALSRLETLVMFAGMDLPSRAIRDQIAGAVQLIVQISRHPDGQRVVTEIAEVDGEICRRVV